VRAIRFKSFGDPSVLELAEVAAPAIAETMVLVRVMAASLPRIPGRDFAGVVEAGPPISQICGRGQAQEAYCKAAAGSTGRVVLRPQE
jgi:NADPH:quinone reductase-like Zn-dependent oxidoreductase